jgi:transcriptional regulator
MYSLPEFKATNDKEVMDFIKHHPFAMLIGVDATQKPVATQVPVFIDEKDGKLFLTGHIMKKTDHHLALEYNPYVLTVFTGAHTYVSASWYQQQQVASTWNYSAVHAKGKLRFLTDTELLDVLKRTTAHFENNPHSPALVEHMQEEYVQKMMKAIVAFEIEVTELNHVFKLSQNRDEKSYDAIITELKKQGGEAEEVAREMEERKPKVFEKSKSIKL